MTKRVVYFARGRGRGHALAGLAIEESLAALRPGVEFAYISYGTGAHTLREHGRAVVDLDLPDEPNLFAIENRLPKALDALPCAVLAAHEEFDATRAAERRGIPCLFLTDWLVDDPADWRMKALRRASEIVFLDDASVFTHGLYRKHEFLEGKLRCVGPIQRPLRYTNADRLDARRRCGLPPEALVVSVFIHPGRRSETIAPLRELLRLAIDQIEWPAAKLLLWDRDTDADFDCVMAASDLAVTKGNRNLALELAAVGVPSISVSYGLNVIDDIRTAGIGSNRTVRYADLDAPRMAEAMRERIAAGLAQPTPFADGALGAAERFAHWLA